MRSVVLSVDCGGDVAARSCSTASSTGAAATAVRPSLNRSRRRTTLALRAGVDSRGAAALSECSVVSFIVSSPTLEQPLDRRHLPTAGLLLDARHRRATSWMPSGKPGASVDVPTRTTPAGQPVVLYWLV